MSVVSQDDLRKTLTMILAGGQGERLWPLTRDRSKPSVPFAGIYRIIDFTLSNALNSGLRRIWVLTQYKSASLMRHIKLGWNLFASELGDYIYTLPPQHRIDSRWYEGTADSVYHNIYTFEDEKPERVLILSGDHVYKMDYADLIAAHKERGAGATLAACEVPRSQASQFGVIEVDGEMRIRRFLEKPADPPPMPGKPDRSLVNMGVYIFDTPLLTSSLREDAQQAGSSHDFGRDVLPALVGKGEVAAYRFRDLNRKESDYWRDIGTIDAYYEASLDLVSVSPVFNLYDRDWPLRTLPLHLPPAKTVFAQEVAGGRLGIALDSLVSGGCIISGGRVERSILSPWVRVSSFSHVADSILMDGVNVGRHANIQRAIVDKGVHVPEGFTIGIDPEQDSARFTVSPGGIVVVPKGMVLG
ncbi:MAG: glucose-1-phosphate adenylyltransferase [Acidobacteria bacterium]|nr:MAG: glucose-1-phosphate adenylyltransferase [Acidobacteriota bacterium]